VDSRTKLTHKLRAFLLVEASLAFRGRELQQYFTLCHFSVGQRQEKPSVDKFRPQQNTTEQTDYDNK